MTLKPYPSLPRTVGLLVAVIVIAGVLALVTIRLFPGWPEIVRMAVPTELALAGVVAWAIFRSGRPWHEALALAPLDPRTLAPLALVLVGSVAVFSELYVIIQRVVPVPPAFEALLRELLEVSGTVDLVATVVVAVVVAPILEEALFRGVVLQGLARRHGPVVGAIWTALFFALFHLYNPWQILPTFFLGMVLAWVVLTTRTLAAAIVLHSAFNGVSLAIVAVSAEGSAPESVPPLLVAVAIATALVLGGFSLLAGMAWLERLTGGGWFAATPPSADDPPRSDAVGKPRSAGSGAVYGGEGSVSSTGPSTARG